jgi:hypothetical protein
LPVFTTAHTGGDRKNKGVPSGILLGQADTNRMNFAKAMREEKRLRLQRQFLLNIYVQLLLELGRQYL